MVPPIVLVEGEGSLSVLLLYADVGLVCQPWHGAPHFLVHELGQLGIYAYVISVLNRGAVYISAASSIVQEPDYLKYKLKEDIESLV